MNETLTITVNDTTHEHTIRLDLSEVLMAPGCIELTDPQDKLQEKGLSDDLIALKNALFQIPGVKSMFFESKTISIIKTDGVDRSSVIAAAKWRIRKYPF